MEFSRKVMMAAVGELEKILDPNVRVGKDADDDELAVWTTKASKLLEPKELKLLSDESRVVVNALRGAEGNHILKSIGKPKPKPESKKEKPVTKQKTKQPTSPKEKSKKVDKIEQRIAGKKQAKKEQKTAAKESPKAKPASKPKSKVKKTNGDRVRSPQGSKEGTAAYEIDLLLVKGTTKAEVFKVLSKKFKSKYDTEEKAHHYLRTRVAYLKREGVKYTVVSGMYKLGK